MAIYLLSARTKFRRHFLEFLARLFSSLPQSETFVEANARLWLRLFTVYEDSFLDTLKVNIPLSLSEVLHRLTSSSAAGARTTVRLDRREGRPVHRGRDCGRSYACLRALDLRQGICSGTTSL
jgi:hypothetical protein